MPTCGVEQCLLTAPWYRDPVPSTLIVAPGHLLRLVLMRTMLALAVSMLAVYQAAMDHLCLSVLTSPLVQDFIRAVSFIALLAGQAAECVCLSALHSSVSLPVSGSGTSAGLGIGNFLGTRSVGVADVTVVAVPSLHFGTVSHLDTTADFWIDTASGTGNNAGGTISTVGVSSLFILGYG